VARRRSWQTLNGDWVACCSLRSPDQNGRWLMRQRSHCSPDRWPSLKRRRCQRKSLRLHESAPQLVKEERTAACPFFLPAPDSAASAALTTEEKRKARTVASLTSLCVHHGLLREGQQHRPSRDVSQLCRCLFAAAERHRLHPSLRAYGWTLRVRRGATCCTVRRAGPVSIRSTIARASRATTSSRACSSPVQRSVLHRHAQQVHVTRPASRRPPGTALLWSTRATAR
jgi:hypothetical protein